MSTGRRLPHPLNSALSAPMPLRSTTGGASCEIAKLARWCLASALLVGGLYPSVAASQVSRGEDGRVVAQRACTECHSIGPEQADATKHFDEDGKLLFVETPPSLQTIAHKFKHDLRGALLAQPHRPMPEPMLRSVDLDKLTDYLASIAGQSD